MKHSLLHIRTISIQSSQIPSLIPVARLSYSDFPTAAEASGQLSLKKNEALLKVFPNPRFVHQPQYLNYSPLFLLMGLSPCVRP